MGVGGVQGFQLNGVDSRFLVMYVVWCMLPVMGIQVNKGQCLDGEEDDDSTKNDSKRYEVHSIESTKMAPNSTKQ